MSDDNPMQRLADYVVETRKRKGLTQEDITKRGGPSKGWIGTLEAGKRIDTPKPETLIKLAMALGESSEGVFRAAGYQFGPDQPNWHITTADGRMYPLIPPPGFPSNVAPTKLKKVRLAGEVGCGNPINLEADAWTTEPDDLPAGTSFAVVARGDSMTRSEILDGDTLFCTFTEKPQHGDIVIALVGDDAVCKLYQETRTAGGKVLNAYLRSDSYTQDVSPIEIDETVRIVGEVVASRPPIRHFKKK